MSNNSPTKCLTLNSFPRVSCDRLYFLVDAITVALVNYWMFPSLWPLGVVQNIQHLSYVFCWERTWFAKRVISWSSLDWDRSRWQPDLVLGQSRGGASDDGGESLGLCWVNVRDSRAIFSTQANFECY